MATEFIEISEQEYQGGASDFIEITEEEFNTPQEPVGTSIGQEISQLPAALKQSFGQPLEAMGETAQVAGFPAVATALKGAIQEPEGYVSAGQRFMEPQEGEFQIAGFAPQYAPRAIAEQTGQIIGSIGSRIAGAITLGGLGALISPATGAAGVSTGLFAGPALFEAAQIVGPVALERAKNNGYTEPTDEDMAYAIVTAAGSGLLNAFGAKYLPGGEKAVGSFSKRLAASFIGEGIPEGLQSLVQQVGETVETKKGIQVSPKQSVGEALIGGGAGAAATIASAPFTPEQIEEQKITERANKEAENLVIGNDNPQGKAVLANKQKLEQEIADTKQVLSVIESTDPVAQKLKLELKEKEAILAAAQGQVDSIVDSNEPITEAERQQIELAKAITEPAPEVVAPVSEVAPEVPAPVTEAITPPAEEKPAAPVAAPAAKAPTEPPVSMVGKQVIPGVTPVPVAAKAPTKPTVKESLTVAPEAPAITPAPVAETPAVAPAPEVAPARLYLNVPFNRKEAAKSAGAKFDSEKKLWYIDRRPTGELPPIAPSFVQEAEATAFSAKELEPARINAEAQLGQDIEIGSFETPTGTAYGLKVKGGDWLNKNINLEIERQRTKAEPIAETADELYSRISKAKEDEIRKEISEIKKGRKNPKSKWYGARDSEISKREREIGNLKFGNWGIAIDALDAELAAKRPVSNVWNDLLVKLRLSPDEFQARLDRASYVKQGELYVYQPAVSETITPAEPAPEVAPKLERTSAGKEIIKQAKEGGVNLAELDLIESAIQQIDNPESSVIPESTTAEAVQYLQYTPEGTSVVSHLQKLSKSTDKRDAGIKRRTTAILEKITPTPAVSETITPAASLLSEEEKLFQVDDELVMRSPYTGEDTVVSYRGKPSDGQAVVWTGKMQMQIPESWLREKGTEFTGKEPAGKVVPKIVEEEAVQEAPKEEVEKPFPKTKKGLIEEIAGEEPKDFALAQDWKNLVAALNKQTKEELAFKVSNNREQDKKFKATQKITSELLPKIKEAVDAAGTKWVQALKNIASENGLEKWTTLEGNSKGEEIYRLANRIASSQINPPAVSETITPAAPAPVVAPALAVTERPRIEAESPATTELRNKIKQTNGEARRSVIQLAINDRSFFPAAIDAAETGKPLPSIEKAFVPDDVELPNRIDTTRIRLPEIKVKSPEEAASSMISYDDTRWVLGGVYFDSTNNMIVATDGRALVAIPKKITKDKIIAARNIKETTYQKAIKKGQQIDGNYPNWKATVPTYEKDVQKVDIDIDDARRASTVLDSINKTFNKKVGDSVIVFNNARFNPKYILSSINALSESGAKSITAQIRSEADPLLLTGDNGAIAVVMPMRVTGRITHQLKSKAETRPPVKKYNTQALLNAAKPFSEYGSNYNRNIAASYERLKNAIDKGLSESTTSSIAEELEIRLNKFQPEALASTTPAVSETITEDTRKTKVSDTQYQTEGVVPKENRFTEDEVRSIINEIFEGKIPDRVKIIEDETNPNLDFKGAYSLRAGTITYNLAYLAKGDDLRFVTNHELGHFIMGDPKFQAEMARLFDSLPTDIREKLIKAIDEAYMGESAGVRAEEAIVFAFGEILENAPDGRNILQRFLDAIVDAINRLLKTKGYIPKNPKKAAAAILLAARNRFEQGEFIRRGDGSILKMTPTSPKDVMRDAEYLAAVERGDMETAQRMVDEAAKKARYNVGPVYHGTKTKFTEFDPNKIGSSTDEGLIGKGFYFHNDIETARIYGENVISAYINQTNPFNFNEFGGISINQVIREKIGELNKTKFTEWLKQNGYDGAKIWGQTMALFPNQIKSADPVTYDDAGNVIPLSQRFQPSEPDIRRMAVRRTPIEPEAKTITEGLAQGIDIGKETNMPINNKIESHIKNFTFVRGIFESASDRLRRAKFTKLATAIDDYYDQAQRRLGFANKILLPAFDEYSKQSKSTKKRIDEEVKMFFAAQENKRDTDEFFDELNPITQKIVTAWQKFGEESGKENQRIGIKVFDRGLQRWRPIGRVEKFWPRVLKPEYKRALMEPDKYQNEYNEIVEALMKSGRINTPEEAEVFISDYQGTGSQNDYFSGIEAARGQAFPEELYDYSMQVMTDYVARWAQHSSRIEQFGQKLGENSKTLWDRSRESTRDRRTIDYITAAQERVEGYYPNDPIVKGMATLNIWASGLQLGNPASSMLNFFGGTTLNAMVGQPGAFSSYLSSFVELRKLGRELKDAREKGIVSRDLMNIIGDHQVVLESNGLAKAGQKTSDFLLKWSGFTPIEQMVRTQSMIIGKSFLRKTLSSLSKNPNSSFSKRALTWLNRNNIDADKLIVEQGTGPETDKLLRYFANISQGSYTIAQTPIFTDTPIGRFLFKYQKFSTQVMRQSWKNTFEPAWRAVTNKNETLQLPDTTRQLLYRLRLAEAKELGDNRKITLDEIPKKVTKAEGKALTIIPVMMWLGSAYVGGEVILRLRDMLFGVLMKGPDYEDIIKAFEDDEDDDELYLSLERAWYNLIGMGALGLIGNYAQFFMDWQDRERVKDPLDPPALSIFKETGTFIQNAVDQGKITVGDVNNYLNRTFSAYRVSQRLYQTAASGLGYSDAPTVAEEMFRREVASINKYARRWAESAGLEYRTKRPMDIAPSKMTSINREIAGYLQRGEPRAAVAYAKEYLNSLPKKERANAIQSMESGARNRQPLRLGSGPMDQAEKIAFKKWLKEKVSKEKFDEIQKLDSQYQKNYRIFLNNLPNK